MAGKTSKKSAIVAISPEATKAAAKELPAHYAFRFGGETRSGANGETHPRDSGSNSRVHSPRFRRRKVVNSRPFQRLRHIHQLALSHLVYPGATHRRFEHSLGVMELASRIYDVVTHPANLDHSQMAKDLVPPANSFQHQYWRQVVRMAALCHDIGHLPFSHAAEKELLPAGWDHERISDE